MDYQKELKRIEEGGSYWKPKPGQFKVKALTELESADPFVKKGTDGKPSEPKEQAKIRLLINNQEEKIWTFGVGLTLASTYGQLVSLASKNNNKLTGTEFTIVVKNDGTKNDYTIIQ